MENGHAWGYYVNFVHTNPMRSEEKRLSNREPYFL